MLRALPKRIWEALRRRVRRRPRHPVIWNVNGANERHCNKYALLVYLPRAFQMSPDDPAFLSHANLRRCRHIAADLGERGYIVDAMHKSDLRFRPRRHYTLVISERLDWKKIASRFRANATHVFLASSMNHVTHNGNVRRRHARLSERGRSPVRVRRVYGENMPAVARSDALVAVGNAFTTGTWREAIEGPVYAFNGFALRAGILPHDTPKDFIRTRRRFLFFASSSQMQKGLDLLLEIFPRHPELQLYVCSQFANEEDFCSAYRQELFETANVHPLGWTTVNSPEFMELLRTCAFVIHPTCSEGQAGSVVHCMHSGLIPLVTREAGIDTGDFGLTLSNDSIEEIERTVLDMSQRPPEWLRDRSAKTARSAAALYTEETFRKRWADIVTEVLARRSGADAKRASRLH